ncbi:hypothetical protein CBM2592_A190029 [Cupriavidus taiwanensis]|nr:hypothetical protein CBM2592_A190029 [Cupriavidus taiwanensis]SOZ78823.1 hypothetical protein CBM2618_A180038 [Cupriavidus taiwanensis]
MGIQRVKSNADRMSDGYVSCTSTPFRPHNSPNDIVQEWLAACAYSFAHAANTVPFLIWPSGRRHFIHIHTHSLSPG